MRFCCIKNMQITLFSTKLASSGHWWLMPVILATQETEIRKIMVQSQPRQIVPGDRILKKPITKKGWWSGSSSSGPKFKPQYCKKKKPC
jgi:hypothetical protein